MREVYGADCVALSKMNLDSYCLEVRSERDSREVYILVYDDGSTSFVSIISDRVRVAYIRIWYLSYLYVPRFLVHIHILAGIRLLSI